MTSGLFLVWWEYPPFDLISRILYVILCCYLMKMREKGWSRTEDIKYLLSNIIWVCIEININMHYLLKMNTSKLPWPTISALVSCVQLSKLHISHFITLILINASQCHLLIDYKCTSRLNKANIDFYHKTENFSTFAASEKENGNNK